MGRRERFSPEHRQQYVELCASRDGINEVLRLPRGTAEEEGANLEAEGWAVKIQELLPAQSDNKHENAYRLRVIWGR